MSHAETLETLLPKCRICLTTSGCIDIFESPRLAECIQLCTNILINTKDEFPRKVCRSCNRLIQAVMMLRTLAISAEFRLRSLQASQNNINNEILECTPDILLDDFEYEEDYQNNNEEVELKSNIETFTNTPEDIIIKQEKPSKTKSKSNKNNKNNNNVEVDSKDGILCSNSLNETPNIPNIKLENMLVCEVCHKTFKNRKSLYLHNRYHDESKRHTCSLCEKKFTTKGDLTKHLRVHTGEKPYSCVVCLKTFSQNSTLKSHLKIHERKNQLLAI